MKNNRISLMMLAAGTAAAVCFAVTYRTMISAEGYEPYEPSEVIRAVRGRILDRNGVLLAGNSSEGGRFFPEDICPHLLGSVSSDGQPQGGAELAFDSLLAGENGYKSAGSSVPVRHGQDVYLTIDADIQRAAEQMLKDAAERYAKGVDYDTKAPFSGSAGAAVMLDCRSGEVLACASWPTYSLNELARDYESLVTAEPSPLPDRALQGLYRPGSALKTVTAAAALSEGTINENTRFYCSSRLHLADTDFSCMKAHGYIDVKGALEVSCNIFFYKTALRLGIDGLLKYQRLFGLGEAPAFELPTLAGQLSSPEASDGLLIQSAIGQGETLCTPLQLAVTAMTIANKGVRYSPTVLRSVGYRDGSRHSGETVETIPDGVVFDIITEGMVSSTKYTYGNFALSQLNKPTAIKTGSPQSPRGYDSTVIGFYPADKPEIAFAVVLEGGANAKHSAYPLIKAYKQTKAQ